jgi:delta-aminolevulinic acid dehydratase/porphobilinogen synthase
MKDRISRIIVRFLIVAGLFLFWAGVISLLFGRKTTKHTTIDHQEEAHEETKVVQKTTEDIKENTKKETHYDVIVEHYTLPDSNGVQHIASKVVMTAKTSKEETKQAYIVIDSDSTTVAETKQDTQTEEEVKKSISYYPFIIGALGAMLVVYLVVRFI